MQDREPNIVTSGLSGPVTINGETLDVQIYRLENSVTWVLEVVAADGASTVWDDPFASDDEALAEFQRTISDEGLAAFRETGKIIRFRR